MMKKPIVELQAFPPKVFCARNGFSMGYWRKLKAQGRAPKTIRLGFKMELITVEAERDWVMMMAKIAGAEASRITSEVDAHRAQAKAAAKKGNESRKRRAAKAGA